MPAGELVLTSRGYLPVESVRSGGCGSLRNAKVVRKVTKNGAEWGPSPGARTRANGFTLRTTGNHAYLVGDAWVEAQGLYTGDQVWSHSKPESWAINCKLGRF